MINCEPQRAIHQFNYYTFTFIGYTRLQLPKRPCVSPSGPWNTQTTRCTSTLQITNLTARLRSTHALYIGLSDSILCSNRDEFLSRPTEHAHFHSFGHLPEPSEQGAFVLSGRDLQAGGTWFGINRAGRVALLSVFVRCLWFYSSDFCNILPIALKLLRSQSLSTITVYDSLCSSRFFFKKTDAKPPICCIPMSSPLIHAEQTLRNRLRLMRLQGVIWYRPSWRKAALIGTVSYTV